MEQESKDHSFEFHFGPAKVDQQANFDSNSFNPYPSVK
jgi:hypothetical protein